MKTIASWLTLRKSSAPTPKPTSHPKTETEPKTVGEWDKDLGADFFKLARYEDAFYAYLQGARLFPKDATYWNGVAVSLYELERYEEAVAFLKVAVHLDPDNTGFSECLKLYESIVVGGKPDTSVSSAAIRHSDGGAFYQALTGKKEGVSDESAKFEVEMTGAAPAYPPDTAEA